MKKKKRKRQAANRPPAAERNEIKPSVKGMIIALIACVPLLILGLTLIYIGFSFDNRSCTVVTQGKVTNTARAYSKNGVTNYRKTYTYEADGREFTGEFIDTDFRIYTYSAVTVCYDPDDPAHSYVKEDADAEKTGDTLLVFVGIVFVVFYILLTFFIISFHKEIQARQNRK